MIKIGSGRPDDYVDTDGRSVPSVTTIIGKFKPSAALIAWAAKLGAEGKSYKEESLRAANFGTLVHDYMQVWLGRGRLGPFTTADEVAAGACVANATANQRIASLRDGGGIAETPMVACVDGHWFGGTFDFYGGGCIVDWKTSGSIYPEYLLQMGAYKLLLEANGHNPDSALVVRIGKSYQNGAFSSTGETQLLDMDSGLLHTASEAFKKLLAFNALYSEMEVACKPPKKHRKKSK